VQFESPSNLEAQALGGPLPAGQQRSWVHRPWPCSRWCSSASFGRWSTGKPRGCVRRRSRRLLPPWAAPWLCREETVAYGISIALFTQLMNGRKPTNCPHVPCT